MPAAAPNDRIQALDGWRTISVALVIISHLLDISSVRYVGTSVFALKIAMPLIDEFGRLGVYLFFVISGYVICRGLIIESEKSGRVSISGFYVRRIFRIVPPLLLYVATLLVLKRLGLIDAPNEVVRALTFTCNLRDCAGWFVSHTWSLSVEEQFYLFIPLIFVAASAYRRSVLLGLTIVLMAVVGGLFAFDQHQAASILQHFVPISIGVIWALFEGRIRTVVSGHPPWAPGFGAIICILALRLTDTVWEPAASVLLPVASAYLLMVTTYGPISIQRALSASWMQFVGRASYGIYLWQQLATSAYPGAGWLFYLTAICGCVLWSLMLFRWFDTPLIEFGRKLSRKTRFKASRA